MSVDGLNELEANFNKLLRQTDIKCKEKFKDVCEDLIGKAINLAPVDLGDLRGSGHVAYIGDFDANIGFNEPYAIKQHEHTEYNHPKGGQAKYLEQPFRENIDKYIKYIAKEIENING